MLARKKYARPTGEMIRKAQADSISFLIVRHPLERLASAYNDKIVHAWPKSFHDKMGHMIIRKFRKVRDYLRCLVGIIIYHQHNVSDIFKNFVATVCLMTSSHKHTFLFLSFVLVRKIHLVD